MIFTPESALMQSVRKRLITKLELTADQIDIELDDEAPAMAGDVYYSITPYGFRVGPLTRSSPGTLHYFFGVRVAVLQRITDVARDRRRNIYAGRLNSLNQRLDKVANVVACNDGIICATKDELKDFGGCCSGEFIRPLVVVSADAKPKLQTGKVTYDSKNLSNPGHSFAAMVRGVNFGEAEFIGSCESCKCDDD